MILTLFKCRYLRNVSSALLFLKFSRIKKRTLDILVPRKLESATKVNRILQLRNVDVTGSTFYAPEGTSGGILKPHRPSVRQSVRPLQIVSQ